MKYCLGQKSREGGQQTQTESVVLGHSLEREGQASKREGGVSPHIQRKPDFGSGSCKREPARGEGRHVLHGTTERKNITCYMGRLERKNTERLFGVLTTVLA